MGDRLGLALQDGLAHGAGVEEVERDRRGSELLDTPGMPRRAEGADHLVSCIDQLANEPGADGTACPCYENAHHVLLICHVGWIPRVYPYDPRDGGT